MRKVRVNFLREFSLKMSCGVEKPLRMYRQGNVGNLQYSLGQSEGRTMGNDPSHKEGYRFTRLLILSKLSLITRHSITI